MAELKLDNDTVNVGDSVYDLRYGNGTVVGFDMSRRTISVKFVTPNTTLNYEESGRRGEKFKRSLYWHNPIIAAPMKSDIFWREGISVARAAVDAMRNIRHKDT